MEILEKLFGSKERVRMMRLFLFNPDTIFSVEKIAERVDASCRFIEKEIAIMKRAGLVKRKEYRSKKAIEQKIVGWALDQSFPYLIPLRSLLIQQVFLRDSDIIGRLSSVGKLRLLVISGVFIQDLDSRVDLLIVGDGLRKWILERNVKNLESEIGKELRYAAFETSDFQYRLNMFDKLIRDIFDFPHRKIVDKIGIVSK